MGHFQRGADVHYAHSGDVAIAYQVVGEGPTNLVFLPFLSSLWWLWRYPRFAPFGNRLAESSRLVLVNTRGMGLSDRPRGVTIEARMDDVLAVLDGGREIDTGGDGFFASFDGPARGIRAACAIRQSVEALGIEIRAGLHTGECELMQDKIGGIAVNTGARIAIKARPGEVLVSSTVRDLVAGSGIAFEDRGEHELKGVGAWRLYSVVDA